MATFQHPQVNVTRGVPFLPSDAARKRSEAAREAEQRRKSALRAHGQMLDQIERSYRELRRIEREEREQFLATRRRRG